ncbi:MAG: aldehyde ferredoxin oxidoreductase N-terminal domain-containing protein [Desulfoplanes sp.]
MTNTFNVLHVDLTSGKSRVLNIPGRNTWLGGCGLAAVLFEQFGLLHEDPFHSDQPMVFAIGPLTGYFPLMSKTVLGFMSPYHGQYAESHAGGRLALALRFAGYEGLVITGRASSLSCLIIGSRQVTIQNVHFMRGMDIFKTGKLLRSMHKDHAGHRSILRIGPAGENQVSYAAINVDTYRHFGRLGSGAVMGSKNLKAVIVSGDMGYDLSAYPEYPKVYKEIFTAVTQSDLMKKYHDLGTAENLKKLDAAGYLPWRNLTQTSDPKAIDGISGETFARDLLLRQSACAGCPVGCIHVGLLREKFGPENEFLYRQVAYDYEPIFAVGSMLGIDDASSVLTLLEDVERAGLDVMSAGVALAWATEALQQGILTQEETLVPLAFGVCGPYGRAIELLGNPAANRFYTLLGQGALAAAKHYGGEDFACVLGQEIAGYATGENYIVSQALGFRHSHLDIGAYSFDQKNTTHDISQAMTFFDTEEQQRVLLCSMVSCLFARKVYTLERLTAALHSLGLEEMAENLETKASAIQAKRWELRFKTGFDPASIPIPQRFRQMVTGKGPLDEKYLDQLMETYKKRLEAFRPGEDVDPKK